MCLCAVGHMPLTDNRELRLRWGQQDGGQPSRKPMKTSRQHVVPVCNKKGYLTRANNYLYWAMNPNPDSEPNAIFLIKKKTIQFRLVREKQHRYIRFRHFHYQGDKFKFENIPVKVHFIRKTLPFILNIFFTWRGFRAGPGLDPDPEDKKILIRNKYYSRSTTLRICQNFHLLSCAVCRGSQLCSADGIFMGMRKRHVLINYIDTEAKCRHLKKLTCKGNLRQLFIKMYRLEIQSVILVCSIQLCELLPLSPSLWFNYLPLSPPPFSSPSPFTVSRGGGGMRFWASDR